MVELKLPRLPDRTPVKLTITLGSELQQALKDYAYLYQATYGTTEQVVDLILRCPFHSSRFSVTSSRYIAARVAVHHLSRKYIIDVLKAKK